MSDKHIFVTLKPLRFPGCLLLYRNLVYPIFYHLYYVFKQGKKLIFIEQTNICSQKVSNTPSL